MSYFIALAFLAILASLGAAGFFMMRDGRDGRDGKPKSKRMAWALTLRIGISIVVFLSILIAWKLGYIHPTGIAPGQ